MFGIATTKTNVYKASSSQLAKKREDGDGCVVREASEQNGK